MITKEQLKKAEQDFECLARILRESITRFYFLGLSQSEIDKIEIEYIEKCLKEVRIIRLDI